MGKKGQIDRNFWYKAGEQGMLCPGISEEYGGVGEDFRYNMVIAEEVSRRAINASLYAFYGLHQVTLGASIVAFASKG